MTIRDIARLANVSIGTVDRVLHDRGRVSQETVETVRRIVRQTGYRRNMHARHLSENRLRTFAVLMPEPRQDSGFWELPLRGIRRAARELEPFRVKAVPYPFDRRSEPSFRAAVERVLAAEPDGLLVAPVLPGPARELCGSLPGNLPVVFFDTPLPDCPGLSFIGQDPFASGSVAAKLMRLLVPDGRPIAALQSVPRDYHIEQRLAGFAAAFPENGKPLRFEEEYLDDPERRSRSLRHLFAGQPDLAGIYVCNASVHRVAEYLEESGRNVRLIGYDLTPRNFRWVKRGGIDFLISQRSDEQAYRGIMRLYRHVLLDEPVEKETFVPIDIVTAENADYYSEARETGGKEWKSDM